MKLPLSYRLTLAGTLAILGVAGRPMRASAQKIEKQPPSDSAAIRSELSPERSGAYVSGMRYESDARLDPRWRETQRSLPRIEDRFPQRDTSSAVNSVDHGSRGKHTLVGVLVGAAAGVVVKFAFPAKCSGQQDMCGLGQGVELGFDMGIGILAGGLIGALLPAGH